MLFSKHAVHERIRLEDLLDQYTRPNGSYTVVAHCQPSRPIVLRLTAGQQEVLAENPALASRFGLVVGGGQPPGAGAGCLLAQIPLCFANLDWEKMESLLEELGKRYFKESPR